MIKKLLFLSTLLCSNLIQGQADIEPTFQNFNEIKQEISGQWISSLLQDKDGFIWVGSQDGLYKYDGKNFKAFRYNPTNKNSLPANWVRSMHQDENGVFWLGTHGAGLVKFDEKTSKFTKVDMSSTAESDSPVLIFDVFTTKASTIWVVSGSGLFRKSQEDSEFLKIKKASQTTRVYELDDGTEIVVFENKLFSFNKSTGRLDEVLNSFSIDQLIVTGEKSIMFISDGKLFYYDFNKNPSEIKMPNNDIITTMSNLQNGKCIIIGEKKNYSFDSEAKTFEIYNYNLQQFQRIGINKLLIDTQNLLWIATSRGLFKESLLGKVFTGSIDYHARKILKYSDTIYIGGGKGLHRIIKNSNRILKQETLNDTRVTSLCKTKDGLWFGHYYGRVFFIDKNDNITSFDLRKNGNDESLRIYGIVEDKNNRIWVSTWRGLYMLSASGEIHNIYRLKSKHDGKDVKILRLQIDRDDNLWAITVGDGLYRIPNVSNIDDAKDVFNYKHYAHNNTTKNSINSDVVMEIHLNQKGEIWIGSDFGINVYNREKDNFLPLIVNGSFFDKKVMAIETDANNLMWISTITDGIYIYDKANNRLLNLREEDGLISNACLYSSSTRDNNILYFGTDKGVQIIDASRFSYPEVLSFPKFTSLQIMGENSEEILDFSKKNQPITINHNQPNFSVSFAITDYRFPDKIKYYYKLDNHTTWTKSDDNTINFNSLNYGNHTLSVKAAYQANDNVPITSLALKINPPWHQSIFAYILIFLVLASILFYFFQLRYRQKVATTKLRAIEELDAIKSNLFTNISHELRTPLTLISGPIEHQLTKEHIKPEDKEELHLVKQNADRLLDLVNQLMDLALIDSGQLKLNITEANLSLLLKQSVDVFQYQAEKKSLKIASSINQLESVWFDSDSVEKIVFNLLSNAIKYATPNSTILFQASQQNQSFVLSVVNKTYKNDKDLTVLFDRFYQQDASAQGVGVGLALVKELVQLNNGTILANKLEDNKIQFTVTLPITAAAFSASEVIQKEIKTAIAEENTVETTNDVTVILVVEDDHDIRKFVTKTFQNHYKVIEASNGEEGVNLALQHIPDLIISDVMMPIKDGVSLCEDLKTNQLTSHIPIVLLTAKVGGDNEIKGLEIGADAYITKPFSVDLLKTRVKALLEIRKQLQAYYSNGFALTPNVKITTTETDFLKRLKEILEINLTSSEFTSERFAEEMLMSRTQLHRKLKAIVNMTASEFLRLERLKLAVQFLKESDKTVTEIAYQVGFNSPSYFSRCFRETYGTSPNEYLAKA
ncbi:two-component regulator propeller domain-containing protein [Ichthyenterobacterium sp. W332]|uniref:histidine kinase n=1 Tax=Microcosmobacter mediterraneus TaxID=3075607 RepID=A0ABU2YH29_9FLAO|nr:two-component regulator propeller domain-containing protein [Ichthyenterobacterium sp. W332]MDT0557085.1 two-component regulator propeller domain-containing protein [Ichthyenterobacterium sp. W332]